MVAFFNAFFPCIYDFICELLQKYKKQMWWNIKGSVYKF